MYLFSVIHHLFKDSSGEMIITAFVHAKGTSARVPSKNLRILGDKPLFCHAIEIAMRCNMISNVVVDSDSDEILSIGKEEGAIPLKRAKRLASNTTTGDDLAYWQASNYVDSDVVLQVIPTAPFLKPDSVDRAIQKLLDSPQIDSVVGVCEEALYLWEDGRPVYYTADGRIPNSQNLKKTVYETTGLYINRTAFVLEHRRRMNVRACAPYLLSKIEAVDINTPEDFEFAEWLWKGMHS
jgi:CMP-N-acetylneuraminic acid synthetase